MTSRLYIRATHIAFERRDRRAGINESVFIKPTGDFSVFVDASAPNIDDHRRSLATDSLAYRVSIPWNGNVEKVFYARTLKADRVHEPARNFTVTRHGVAGPCVDADTLCGNGTELGVIDGPDVFATVTESPARRRERSCHFKTTEINFSIYHFFTPLLFRDNIIPRQDPPPRRRDPRCSIANCRERFSECTRNTRRLRRSCGDPSKSSLST